MDEILVAGRMEQTFAEHTRRLGILIHEEQEKPLPNNALIAALCDSIRLAREATAVLAGRAAAAPELTDEEVAFALHSETSTVHWLNESGGIVALTDKLNVLLRSKAGGK